MTATVIHLAAHRKSPAGRIVTLEELVPATVRVKGWLPLDVAPEVAAKLRSGYEWVMQEKADGVHVIVYVLEQGVYFTNKRGEPRAVPPAMAAGLRQVPRGTVLAAEQLHDGRLVPFDLLVQPRLDLRQQTVSTRLAALVTLAARFEAPVELVRYALSPQQKRRMWEALRRERAEGAMYKLASAAYAEARTPTLLREKFTRTADVIVKRRKGDGTASFDMYVAKGPGLQFVGRVSAHKFWGELAAGEIAVAEVRYAYATNGPKLVQPRVIRLRTDKAPEECTQAQLVVSNRWNEEG